MPKLKLSSKILVYFLIVSVLPLAFANIILISSANSQLLEAASEKQQAVAIYLSDRVGSYLDNNVKQLANISQVYSSGTVAPDEINQNLAVLLHQNSDIERIAIVNVNGMEEIVFDKNGLVQKREDVSDSDAFKAVNFLAGKNYISTVNYSEGKEPSIIVAVPVLVSDFSQHISDLKNADFGTYRSADDMKGAVIASYKISDLWQTVLSTQIGEGGYAYVVDSLGNLVAHPDNAFLQSNQKLIDIDATKQFINGDFATKQTQSETGQPVISTPQLIPNSGWGVIVEEPVSSIYASINSYLKLAATIGVSAVIFSVLISIFFSRQLIEPLRKLTQGAKKFGKGDFTHTIDVQTKDEIQDLAETFNKMGQSIQKLVNDLKLYNEDLLIEQTKLNSIIKSVSDGVIAINASGRIITINPPAAQLVGKRPEELRGAVVSDTFPWEQNGKKVEIELKKPGLYHFSDLTLSQAGRIAYLDLVISTIDSKENEIAAIVTVHDQTKSRELDFMKLDFVAIAAHELRTPLTVLRGYLDMLNSEAVKNMSILNIESLQKAIVGANQLRDLISKLLNIARIERGEMEIFIEKTNLSRLIKENVHQHVGIAAQNEQTLKFVSNTESTVTVPADPSSINEVLNNLIGNALKYAGTGKDVEVHMLAGPEEVRIEVRDNGPGIPAKVLDKLFTKFYRAERTMIAGTRGTGLGLFVSKTIVELQGGKIGVESVEGQGTTFYFTLPIYAAEKHDRLISKQKKPGGIHGWFKKRPHS